MVCAATQPETVLHLNTKFYIYRQLLAGTHLYIEQHCSNSCGKSRNFSWVKGWGRVEIEYAIGSIRPDIVIVGKDDTYRAIEIKVTHPVEDDKATFYKNQNIGWLEIEAIESIYDGENPWTIAQQLPSICNPPIPWTCNSCINQLKREKQAKLREQQQEEYREHNYSKAIYAKMVDFYYPTGKKHRDAYYLNKVVRDDKLVGVSVQAENYPEHPKVLFEQDGEICKSLIETAFTAVNPEIDRWRKFSAIVDERDWSDKIFVARDFGRYPYRYEWDEDLNKWVERERQKFEPQNPFLQQYKPQNTPVLRILEKEGICERCGQLTKDWRSFYGKTGTCKCRKCFPDDSY